jgi:hypothetical protein
VLQNDAAKGPFRQEQTGFPWRCLLGTHETDPVLLHASFILYERVTCLQRRLPVIGKTRSGRALSVEFGRYKTSPTTAAGNQGKMFLHFIISVSESV